MRLLPPVIEINPENPFDENDQLGRKALAQSITKLLASSEDPLVISLNGAWGTGKSTFAKMLDAHLLLPDNGFKTIFLDAFEMDYIEDPFIPISMKIVELLKQEQDSLGKVEEFTKKALRVGTKVLGKLAFVSKRKRRDYEAEVGRLQTRGRIGFCKPAIQ